MADSELSEVYSAAHLYEAHFIKSALEDAGIEARVVESPLLTALGELPASAIAPRVWVRTEAFDQARKIAARALDIPMVGLDLMVPAADQPEYVFIEANERAGLANHEPQPTAERFVDLLFPHS